MGPRPFWKRPGFWAVVVAALVSGCGSSSSSSAAPSAPKTSAAAVSSPTTPASPVITYPAVARTSTPAPIKSTAPTTSIPTTRPPSSASPTQAPHLTPIEFALADGYTGIWTGPGITLTIPYGSSTGTLKAGDVTAVISFSLVNGRTIVPTVTSATPDNTGIRPGVVGFLLRGPSGNGITLDLGNAAQLPELYKKK